MELHFLSLKNQNLDFMRVLSHKNEKNKRELINSGKIAKTLNIATNKIISILQDYGNTSAVGIPLALAITQQYKPFLPGEKLLLTTAGAGMTAGTVIFGV